MVDPSTTRERELERFHTIVEVAGQPIYTLNEKGRFTYVNDALVEETGYSRAELLGEHVAMLLSDEDIERCLVAIEELVETGERSRAVDIEVRTADGDRRPAAITIAILPAEDDGIAGTVGVGRPLD